MMYQRRHCKTTWKGCSSDHQRKKFSFFQTQQSWDDSHAQNSFPVHHVLPTYVTVVGSRFFERVIVALFESLYHCHEKKWSRLADLGILHPMFVDIVYDWVKIADTPVLLIFIVLHWGPSVGEWVRSEADCATSFDGNTIVRGKTRYHACRWWKLNVNSSVNWMLSFQQLSKWPQQRAASVRSTR